MAYENFNDLARRADSDKVLRDKAFNIAKNPKYDRYQRGLASMLINFLIKSWKGVVFLIMRLNKIFNYLNNYTNQLLEILRKEKFILNLKIIFSVLI